MTTRSAYRAVGREEDTSGIATRVSEISVSVIKQMPVLATKVPGCVSVGQGIPSTPTPLFIRQAVAEALMSDDSLGKYSIQPGLPDLKIEIGKRLTRLYAPPSLNPDTDLFVSCGAMEALTAVISTIVERGDEVILFTPSYSSHIQQVLFAEGVPVFVALDEDKGWALDIDLLKAKITKRTKAIVVCNPGNPTGALFSEFEVRQIVALARERDMFLISDEAYDFLTYDGILFFSASSLKEEGDSSSSCTAFPSCIAS